MHDHRTASPRWPALVAWWQFVLPPAPLAGAPVPVNRTNNPKENHHV
ncbi:hypothetical protein [Blastococcus sp. CT_GayMR16]|nr:hypothetical protein [Blastococcus sp. CT_GayMR16]